MHLHKRDRHIELPGRGRTFIREVTGPEDAPAVILLHGLGATGRLNWGACYRALGNEFRVISIDHRGHGRGIATRNFHLSDCADDVVALADELGIEQVVPVGYSMGGPIAQLISRRHPGRVRAMVLCATACSFHDRSMSSAALSLFPVAGSVVRLASGVELVAPRRQRELAAAIPGSTRFDIEGGHDACVNSPAFVPALVDACRSVRARDATDCALSASHSVSSGKARQRRELGVHGGGATQPGAPRAVDNVHVIASRALTQHCAVSLADRIGVTE